MFKVIFTEMAEFALKSFINYYEDGFVNLYKNSGLWAENLILQQYYQTANQLNSNIIDKIENKLIQKDVLGRKPKLDNWYELDFYVGDRLICLVYSENKKVKTRFVESIEIGKKYISV